MLQKTNILYIGRNTEIRELVVRLINKNESWNGNGAASLEEVRLQMAECLPELILLGNGLSAEDENEMRNLLNTACPGAIVIQHYGGGSGLLSGEIMEALSRKHKA